jgi:hypothetical protein
VSTSHNEALTKFLFLSKHDGISYFSTLVAIIHRLSFIITYQITVDENKKNLKTIDELKLKLNLSQKLKQNMSSLKYLAMSFSTWQVVRKNWTIF